MPRLIVPNLIAPTYAMLATLAAPALRLMLRRRVRRGKEIAARLPERWGEDATPRPPGRLLWLHGASVGEAMSLLPVLAELAESAPDLTMLVTTGTVSSGALLARRLPELGLQARVLHRFVPLDVPRWVARFLAHWRPDAVAFVESEIWPNIIAACVRAKLPLMLLNARLSPRSAAGWRRAGAFGRRQFAAFASIQAQSEVDAARFSALGGRQVGVAGNLKFAAAPLPVSLPELERLRERLAGRPVWLAASTHPGEEEPILAAHMALAAQHPRLLTIIAPRHPERGADVAALAGAVASTRRALGEDPPDTAGVWVADTLGELGLLYRLAQTVFVGGSLVPHGGQNPLEPARLGCAVAIGPHTHNFAAVVEELAAAGALTPLADAAALVAWVDALLADTARRAAMGDAGIAASRRHGDLPREVATTLLDLLASRHGCPA